MVIVRILGSVCGRGGFGRGRARADVMMSLQRAVCVVGQHKLVKEKNKQSSEEKSFRWGSENLRRPNHSTRSSLRKPFNEG